MSDTAVLTSTAVAVVAIVVLIVRFRFDPVVALVAGSLFLGLVGGLGPTGTVDTVLSGFGDIMTEIGLLIVFGVLLGSMLSEMRAIQRLVAVLLAVFGPRGTPYALALTIGTLLQSIFLDVLLVISAPLAARMAPRIGRLGLARVATALAIGLECGIVLMVPGVATLALAGVLGVSLGRMLIFGLVVIVPTIVISILVMSTLFRVGFWNEELDEQQGLPGEAEPESEPEPPVEDAAASGREAPLILLFAPVLVSLLLIASGAFLELAGVENPVATFLASPLVALFLGLVGTSLVGRATIGRNGVGRATKAGFGEAGQILALTGVGGSLAATVSGVGVGDILGDYFTAGSSAPLLVVWGIAAVLHVAVGSVSISAITAAGILAPVASTIGLDPVLIALAAGAGSLFVVHVTSNTFWLLQSLLGQTTRGTLKSCTIGVSVASVVALGMVLVLSLFL